MEWILLIVIVIMLAVRWVIEWWATGRQRKIFEEDTDDLIKERREDTRHVKESLAEIKEQNTRFEEMILDLDQMARDTGHRASLTEVRTTNIAERLKGDDAE